MKKGREEKEWRRKESCPLKALKGWTSFTSCGFISPPIPSGRALASISALFTPPAQLTGPKYMACGSYPSSRCRCRKSVGARVVVDLSSGSDTQITLGLLRAA